MTASPATGFTLFDTTIGRCGVAWSEHGIVRMQLPDGSDDRLRERLLQGRRAVPAAVPPPAVQAAIEAVVALLRGEAVDLSGVALDMHGVPEFHRRVYALALRIAPGQTMTYGEMATQLGDPALARDIGHALGRNPFAPIVPCHRVLAAGGQLGGFSAFGGAATKLRMLAIEGARVTQACEPDLFDDPADARGV